MASLQKRGKYYYIVFSKRINGKLRQKKFSLKTKRKRRAEKLKVKFESLREEGKINPFNGWHPKQAQKKKPDHKKNCYILEKAADEFIKKRSQANQVTKDNYRRHLEMLMAKLGSTIPVKSISEDDIRNFCFRADLAVATQRSYLTHLKVFFNWLNEIGITDKNVCKRIGAPRLPNKIAVKTITYGELMSIFDAFDEFYSEQRAKKTVTRRNQMRLWFKPLVITTYYSGLRAKEVVNLRWRDIDLVNGYMTITCTDMSKTKTGKERCIPIDKPLLSWLINWYLNQGEPTQGYVFPSARSKNGRIKMCKQAMSKTYKKFVRLAGLPESITFHGLRHTCASDLLRKGETMDAVADFLGDTPETIARFYKHLNGEDLRNRLRSFE